MGGKAPLTPTFAQLVKRARSLREWTRVGIYEGDSPRPENLQRTNAKEARHQLNRKIDQIAKDQRLLNNFYKEIGLPTLPKNHTVPRYWEQRVLKLQKEAQRQKEAEHQKRRKRPVGRPSVQKRFDGRIRKGHDQPQQTGNAANAGAEQVPNSHENNKATESSTS